MMSHPLHNAFYGAAFFVCMRGSSFVRQFCKQQIFHIVLLAAIVLLLLLFFSMFYSPHTAVPPFNPQFESLVAERIQNILSDKHVWKSVTIWERITATRKELLMRTWCAQKRNILMAVFLPGSTHAPTHVHSIIVYVQYLLIAALY